MKNILLIFLLIVNCCCSTIKVKKDNGFGHPYEGLTYSAQDGACLTIVGLAIFPLLVIIIPYAVIDIAGSIVADTVILPIDLAVTNDKPRKKGGDCISP